MPCPREPGRTMIGRTGAPEPLSLGRARPCSLARYAVENENFVLVVVPHNGRGARSAPKRESELAEGVPGNQGQSPWLVWLADRGLPVDFDHPVEHRTVVKDDGGRKQCAIDLRRVGELDSL